MFLNTCQKHQVVILLLPEIKVKWMPSNLNKKTLGREIKIIEADSLQWDVNTIYYLPGRILSSFGGKSRSLI